MGAVDIASMSHNIGHCSHQERKKKLHHWTATLDITTAVGIASMDNNIGQQPWTLQPLTTTTTTTTTTTKKKGCGQCINEQQHWTLQLLWALHQWTTTLDNNIGHYSH